MEDYKYLREIENISSSNTIVLTASQPFTTELIHSNIKLFKYEWIWEKSKTVGFLNAKNAPLKKHENVLIFSKGKTANCNKNNMKYYPQDLIEINKIKKSVKQSNDTVVGNRPSRNKEYVAKYTGYPTSILRFNNENKQLHPTQKPVALFEYLIKTYTNENDLILDNCIGSGTTAIAAINTNRNYIGFEKDEKYYKIACERIKNHNIKNII